jgi:hypothetical protein
MFGYFETVTMETAILQKIQHVNIIIFFFLFLNSPLDFTWHSKNLENSIKRLNIHKTVENVFNSGSFSFLEFKKSISNPYHIPYSLIFISESNT